MPAKWHKYSYTAQREERKPFILILTFLLFLLVLFTLIHNHAVTMYRIQAETMIPTLSPEERVISTPLYSTQPVEEKGFFLLASAKRGDLVVISPANTDQPGRLKRLVRPLVSFITFQRIIPFSAHDTPGKKPVIRRLLGFPGDTLYLESGILHIKPAGSSHYLTEFELVDRSYELRIDPLPDNWDSTLPFSHSFPEITLADDEFFVLCDNRLMAGDSRIWGSTRRDRIIGKVLFRYWPIGRLEEF